MGILFSGNIAMQASGPLPIAQGGTGQTNATAVINSLLPSQSGQANKVLVTDGTSLRWSASSASAAGSDTEIQFNDAGMTSASSTLTFNKTSGLLSAPAIVVDDFKITGLAGVERVIKVGAGALDRWMFGADSTPEVGTNSGSDFKLVRVADNGSTQSVVYSVSRSTGVVDFKVAPTINGTAIASGSGTVTSVASSGSNGVSITGSPITSTGSITIGLGAITPSSVAATGAVSGSNLSGTNTGDQTITLTGDVTGSGTGSFAATLANSGVTSGTYGSTTEVPVLVIDAKGRVTSASTVAAPSAPVTSVAGKTGVVTLAKADVGLTNVDNTSDASKPVSTATQTALNAKQDSLVSGTSIKTLNSTSLLGSGDIALSKSDVGLSNVDNTSDASKPVSSATQTALNAKQATLVSGTNIRTLGGNTLLGSTDLVLAKSDVGLTNVDNTSDASKPVSTATQTALNAKQDSLVSGTSIKTMNGTALLGSGNITTGDVTLTGTQTLTNKTLESAVFTKGYTEGAIAANTGTAYTIDLNNGTLQILTLTGNVSYTFPTAVLGKSFTLLQKQDGTGGRTATWPASVKWSAATAPTISSAINALDKFTFVSDGTYWYGSTAGSAY